MNFVADYSGSIEETTALPRRNGMRVRWLAQRLGRCAVYNLISLPIVWLVFIIAASAASAVFGLLFIGIGFFALSPLLQTVSGIGAIERSLLGGILDEHIEPPIRDTRQPGFSGIFIKPLSDGSYWRELTFVLFRFIVTPLSFAAVVATASFFFYFVLGMPWEGDGGISSFFANLAMGLAALAFGTLAILVLTAVQVSAARYFLGPGTTALTTRAHNADANRTRTLTAAEAERRRIERNLHDGAQARLATVALDLGRAKHRIERDGGDDELRKIIESAHSDAKEAIVELRDLARGIHPAVLSDRGLDAALSDVAARCTVPVHLDVSILNRPMPHIESAAYFCVSELLANVTKHSRASQAWVTVRGNERVLRIDVTDNSVGGADAALGTGLFGLTERVTSIDGQIAFHSPLAFGTQAVIEIPMASVHLPTLGR